MEQEHLSGEGSTTSPSREYTLPGEPLQRYQTFWLRLGAGMVDGVLLLPLNWLSVRVFESVSTPAILLVWFIFHSFSYIIYSVTLHGLYGQTLGKMLTGVRVLDVSEKRLSFVQAILRDSVPSLFTALGVVLGANAVLSGENPMAGQQPTLAGIVIGVTAMVWFVAEIVTMLWNDKRRAVHDYIARSVVVRTR